MPFSDDEGAAEFRRHRRRDDFDNDRRQPGQFQQPNPNAPVSPFNNRNHPHFRTGPHPSQAMQRAEKRGMSPEGGMNMQRRRLNNNMPSNSNSTRSGGYSSGQMRPNSYGAQADGRGYSNNGNMMTLRQFLSTQPETVSEEEAMIKYKEYKQNFRRKRFQEFFVAHKNEEWFREKYFPDEKKARERVRHGYLDKRCGLYTKLVDEGYFDQCKLDGTNEREILQMMDTVVVFLEGGTENDLQNLNGGNALPPHVAAALHAVAAANDAAKYVKKGGEAEEGEADDVEVKKEDEAGPGGAKAASAGNEVADKVKVEKAEVADKGHNGDASSSQEIKPDLKAEDGEKLVTPRKQLRVDELEWAPRVELHKTKSLFLRNVHPAATRAEIEKMCRKYPGFIRLAVSEPMPERRFYRRAWATFRGDVDINNYCWQLQKLKLRDQELGVIVNRELSSRTREVEDYFKHKPLVKECIRLACKMIQSMDKQRGLWQWRRKQPNQADDASNAGAAMMAAAADESNDAADAAEGSSSSAKQHGNQLPAKFLDEDDPHGDDEAGGDAGRSVVEYETPHAQNPLLRKALKIVAESDADGEFSEYKIDRIVEARSKTTATSGSGSRRRARGDDDDNRSPESINDGIGGETYDVEYDVDDEWTRVLDELIWYLRIVHSIDFYAAKEYPIEDEMPYQLGIMYMRGRGPGPGDIDKMKDSLVELQKRLKPWIVPPSTVPQAELLEYGLKSVSEEIEKFIKANTVAVGAEKYLCPLSNKKFKGPDFVRKHIINKHEEKLLELKNEVVFFNNYLRDPNRPIALDSSTPSASTSKETSSSSATGGGQMGGSGGNIQSRLGFPLHQQQQQSNFMQGAGDMQGAANPMAAAAAMMNPMVDTFTNPIFMQQMAAAMATSMAAMMGGAMMGGAGNMGMGGGMGGGGGNMDGGGGFSNRFGSQPGRRGGGVRRPYRDLDAPDDYY